MHPLIQRFRGLVLLLALAVSGTAVGDVEFYAGVGIGSSDASVKPGKIQSTLISQGFDVTSVKVDAEDVGWRFLTGLRFTDVFAVELGYVDLGDIQTEVDGNIPVSQTGQFQQAVANTLPVMPRGLTLAGVARFRPMADDLSLAVKLGVIDADVDRRAAGTSGAKESNADPYYGVVVGYDFSDTWRGVLGFEVFDMVDSTNYWSAGLEFKFPKYNSN